MDVKIDSHFIPVNDKIVETILSYGDETSQFYQSSPIKAAHTRWKLQDDGDKFKYFIDKFNEIYPKYTIEELWCCTYRQGNYAETHNHIGFDLSFAWFVDTCSSCTPLVFPNHIKLWEPPHEVITPRNGMLHVFSGKDLHYVAPHTCEHHRIVMSGNCRKTINTEVLENDPWH